MIIVHGDDRVKISGEVTRILSSFSDRHIPIQRVEVKNLTVAELESILGTSQLFAQEKCVLLDGLHSLPKSKRKDELLSYMSSMQSSEITTILVENKVLTPAQLRKFSTAQVILHKLPMLLFTFVETIGVYPKEKSVALFHQILQTQEAEFVFAMICRQIRTLLSFAADGKYEGPPFGKQKIVSQAKAFSLDRLFAIHTRLVAIDQAVKTSRSPLELSQEIDLLLLSL